MEEIWKSIKDYEGLYEVSNWGRVRNARTGFLLKLGNYRSGYLRVNLSKNGKVKTYSIHRIVGIAFPDMVGWTEDAKGRPLEELDINHKDKNRTNNRVDNLEWCGRLYNIRYSLLNGESSKKVYMYTQDDKLCGLWPSTRECARNGFNQGHVAECCRGILTKYKGFKWSYEPPMPPKALPYFEALPRS